MSKFPNNQSCMETLRQSVADSYLQRRGRDVTLECAAGRLLLAIKKLGENPPDQKPVTYFEASPTKDQECYERWKELNDSVAFIRKLLENRKASEADGEVKP
jgi:hypothetical protein